MGKKVFATFAEAVRHVIKTKPRITNPSAYVGAIESLITKRSESKKKEKGKHKS